MSYNKALVTAEVGQAIGEYPLAAIHEITPALIGLANVFARHRMKVITATNFLTAETNVLSDYLRGEGVEKVYLGLMPGEEAEGGPTYDDATALDLNEAGFNVAIIKDAVRPRDKEHYEAHLKALGTTGIRVMTAEEVALDVVHTPHVVQIGDKKL